MIVNDWALVDTKVITLAPAEEEIAGWRLLDTKTIILAPGEEEIAGWKLLLSKTITLVPSEEEIAGWKLLDTEIVTLSPPTMECSTDADCPEGYVCVDGVCVKKEAVVPWTALAIGAAAVGGIILIISGIQEKRNEHEVEIAKKPRGELDNE